MEADKRCATCKHWAMTSGGAYAVGECQRASAQQFGYGAWPVSHTEPSVADAHRLKLALMTSNDFGCVRYEVRA